MRAPTSIPAQRVTHWVAALLSSLLVVAVLADLSSVGRRYFFCLAMHQVRPDACCPSTSARRDARAEGVEISAEDCCEAHTLPAVAPWTSAPRSTEIAAPRVVTLAMSAYEPCAMPVRGIALGALAAMRTGPPWSPARERSRLMVFHI